MKYLPIFLGVLLLTLSPAAPAAEPCKAFKWDLAREVALFTQTPAGLKAGSDSQSAPRIEPERFYEATLHPQAATKLAVRPTKRMLDDGAYAGLFHLRVATAGLHRVAVDSGFWLDVVADGKALEAVDFNGSPQCAGPRKVVVYDLPAGSDLILQFSAANSGLARFSITRVDPPAQ